MDWPDRGRKRGYWINILVAIDQGIGTLLGIDADETISSYVGRVHYGEWQMRLIDTIFKVLTGERDHCLNNIEREYLL